MKKKLVEYAIPLCVILIFFRFIFDAELFGRLFTFLFLVYGAALSLFVFSKQFINRLILVFFCATTLCIVLTAVFGANDSYKALPFFVAAFGFSLSAMINPISQRVSLGLFLIFTLFFLACVALQIKPSQLFNVSRNFVSIFFLILLSVYFISCWQAEKKPSMYPVLVSLLFSFWGVGRAGIAVFLMVVFLMFFFLVCFRRKVLYVSLSALVGILLVFLIGDLGAFAVGFERFERLGLESLRNDINKEYFLAAVSEVYSLVWGVELWSLESVRDLGGNPHNSFIALHVNFGMLGFLIIGFSILFALARMLLTRCWILMIVMVACLARSFFDIAAFYGPLDFLILFPIVFYFSRVRLVKTERRYS